MGLKKLLDSMQLASVSDDASKFGSAISSYADNIQKVVDSFNDDVIVQAFYSTGQFGQEQKERLVNICKALRKYAAIVSEGNDSLVVQTQNYVERQKMLNEKGTAGAITGAVSGLVAGGVPSGVPSGIVGGVVGGLASTRGAAEEVSVGVSHTDEAVKALENYYSKAS